MKYIFILFCLITKLNAQTTSNSKLNSHLLYQKNASEIYDIAEDYREQGKYRDAILTHLEVIQTTNERDFIQFLSLISAGVCYLELKDAIMAEGYLTHAMSMKPNNPSNQRTEAEFKKALNESKSHLLYFRALARLDLGNKKGACGDFITMDFYMEDSGKEFYVKYCR